jgi:hypothetical protein
MPAINTETTFCPAASCVQLQRSLGARDIHISNLSIPLARHKLKFSHKSPKQWQFLEENSSHVPKANGCTTAMPHSRLESETIVKMIHPQVKFVGTFR